MIIDRYLSPPRTHCSFKLGRVAPFVLVYIDSLNQTDMSQKGKGITVILVGLVCSRNNIAVPPVSVVKSESESSCTRHIHELCCRIFSLGIAVVHRRVVIETRAKPKADIECLIRSRRVIVLRKGENTTMAVMVDRCFSMGSSMFEHFLWL